MTNVQITHPAPEGDGTSVLINGVEMNRALSTYKIEASGGDNPKVTIDLCFVTEQRLCMADAELILGDSTVDMLEAHGWTRPGLKRETTVRVDATEVYESVRRAILDAGRARSVSTSATVK